MLPLPRRAAPPRVQGLWLATLIGLSMFGLLYNFCPAIFAAMGAKPEVRAMQGAAKEQAGQGCRAGEGPS